MIRWVRAGSWMCLVAASFLLVAAAGCNKHPDEHAKGKDKEKAEKARDHEDEHPTAGPHGGPLVEWGEEEYHGELVVDHPAKEVIVYILDGKAKHAPKIAADKITDVKVRHSKPEFELVLKHDPKRSDEKGIAFIGKNEFFAKPGEITVNVTWKVEGKGPHGSDVTYPLKKDAKDKTADADLFSKPGGIYTAADIKANGNMTPAEKFKDKKLVHEEAKAKPGDKICPISGDKANPECYWTVHDQKYEFCCLPCVKTFVRRAHDEQAKVKNANEYVAK